MKEDKDSVAFYAGASLFLDLDSVEVDAVLGQHGLSIEENGILVCRDCLTQFRPLILTAARAAEIYGVSPRTVAYAAAHGHINAAQGPGGWEFPRAEFERWRANPPRPGPKPRQD